MSASKVKHEFRTLLDLGPTILTKDQINSILQSTKIQTKETSGSVPVYIGNQINIGMFVLRLQFSQSKIEEEVDKLEDFGCFSIRMFENYRDGLHEIKPAKHSIFKSKVWSRKNLQGLLTSADLAEVILLCGRLERLKAFN